MTSSVEEQIEAYKKIRQKYVQFTRLMKELITTLLKQEEIEYIPPLQCRTKTVLSFEEKIRRKKYDNPLRKITDLSGCRIIVYYPEEILRAEDLIKENFKVDPKNTVNKREQLPKNQFGYGGIHYVVSLSDEMIKNTPEYREFKDMKHEIQIHTICQYTWATIQRRIEYKNEELISPILSRRLAILSALFELADEEFQRIRNEGVSELREYEIAPMPIQVYARNSETVRELIRNAHKNGIVEMMSDEDRSAIDEIMGACDKAELRKIGELEDVMSNKKVQDHLFQLISQHKEPIRAGPFTLILLIIYHSSEKITREFLEQKGWKEPMLGSLTNRNVIDG